MTDAQLKANADYLAKLAGSWTRMVGKIVNEAIDRAHAHANLALTETLKATPDGRRTLRRASHNRSFVAALADIDDLLVALTGPTKTSLAGKLRDVRAVLYRAAFIGWVRTFPEPYTVGRNTPPSQARINLARGLVLHGMDLRTEIAGSIDRAKRDLLATIEVAARRESRARNSADLLKAWRDRAVNAITSTCKTAIGDSLVALESLAGVDAVKPQYRPAESSLPEVA